MTRIFLYVSVRTDMRTMHRRHVRNTFANFPYNNVFNVNRIDEHVKQITFSIVRLSNTTAKTFSNRYVLLTGLSSISFTFESHF